MNSAYPTTPEQQDDIDMQFDAVARGLGAEPGDNGYYRGIANTAPFLYKQTSAVPSGYMFKFRRFTIPLPAAPRPRSVGVQPEWHDTLSSEYANAGVRSEVDYDYLYLWIDDPRQLTAASVVALVAACVQAHSQYFPHVGQYCSSCRSTGKATLVQNGSSVTTICSDCLDRKRQDVLAKNQSLNASDARVSLLLPLALVLGSLGWAVCWTLYDTIFRITKSNWIVVPTVLVMLVATGVGFGLGWPIGHSAGSMRCQGSGNSLMRVKGRCGGKGESQEGDRTEGTGRPLPFPEDGGDVAAQFCPRPDSAPVPLSGSSQSGRYP